MFILTEGKKIMTKRKRYNKYIGNTTRTVAMNTTELVGIQVAGTITGMPGVPAGLGNQVIGTGFGLAGVSGLTNTAFGKGGVLDSLSMLDQSPRKRRRR